MQTTTPSREQAQADPRGAAAILLRAMRGLGRIRAPAGHRTSAATGPEAGHDQLLEMLPPWVDPLAGVALDVGANEGNWTVAALAAFPGLQVLAIEPAPAPCELLQRRFGEEAASLEELYEVVPGDPTTTPRSPSCTPR